MWVVAGGQAIQTLTALLYWQASNAYDERRGSLDKALSAQSTYNTAAGLNALIWFAGFICLIVWLANVHTSTTSLLPGPKERKYSRAWSIGVWFIPIANLVSTPQVIAENQRIAFAARSNGVVNANWRSTRVYPELVWWWILVAGGLITAQFGRTFVDDYSSTSREFFTGLTAIIAGSGITAIGVTFGAIYVTELNNRLKEPAAH